MKIKTKLTLGVGVLFLLIVLLSVVGARYINNLKQASENILIANDNSMQYTRNMLAALEDNSDSALIKFENNLQLQEKNETEFGEQEVTSELRSNFELYKQNANDTAALKAIKKNVFAIMEMNMHAIQRKSEVVTHTADNAFIWIAFLGTFCFVIAFVLLVNLPSNIANPIKELTSSIKQIAEKNYSERVHFESHSEFGDLAKSFNKMAEKLQEYNNSSLAKLMTEKTRIETLINNMHDPVVGLDEKLKVIFVNQEAVKIIGMNENEIVGNNAKDLALKNDLIRSLIQDLGSVNNEEASAKLIKIYSDKKEGYFEKETLHISITPTGEQVKRLVGHVLILRNVTEYKELDSAKTNFIATVSHEYKTPISSIKMSLQLLENERVGTLNKEQKNLVESIKDDADRLLKITGELLNMTQVESGTMQVNTTPSDVLKIVDYAISATKSAAEQKHIKIKTTTADNLPKVLADSEKTAWVLTNLLSNAIRYSYDNSIVQIDITTENSKVKFAVTDTGQGISPQYIDRIFDRYFRIPNTKKEGTGLGLSISKEFIEAQGGTLSVRSEFGAGSAFSFELNQV